MQNRISKYGMDSVLYQYLNSDMSLSEIKDKLKKSFGIYITTSDIEDFLRKNKDSKIWNKFMEKKEKK